MTTHLFNWREMPFVRLFIPLALGIVVAENWQPNSPIWANTILSLSALCVVFLILKKTTFRWRWLFGIPLSIFMFSLGVQLVFYQNELRSSNHFKNILDKADEKLVVGIVTDRVEKAKNIRLTIETYKMGNTADSLHDVTGNLLVYVKKDSTIQSPVVPQYGDLVVFQSRVNAVEPPKNPDAFDFKNYLHHQNIHFQSFVEQEGLKILAQKRGNPIFQIIANWQAHLVAILKEHLPTEREFAVGSALILGYKDAMTEEVRDAYVQTGSMHILAVSGMHIMLIFSRLDKILDLYKSGNRRWRWAKVGISIVLIWLVTFLTGAGTSVVRAAMMATVVSFSKGMGRSVSIYNVLAASAFLLLLWQPFWLFDVGFQLSYFAVVGIVYFQPKIEALWVSKNKIARKAWEITAVGLAAQLVVTPISLYYFHQFPTYFWLSGLLAVEVSTYALVSGITLFFISFIPPIEYIVGKILFGFVWIMNEIVFFIQKLPLSILSGFSLKTLDIFFIYLILLGTAIALKTRRLKTLIYPLSILLVMSLFYAFSERARMQQREIIVYHIYKNSVIDYIDGKNCYSFSKKLSDEIDAPNKIKFAAENHRTRLKVNSLYEYDFVVYEKQNNLLYHSGVSQFYDFRMAILDKLPQKGVLLHINTVLIHQNARFSISDLLQYVHFETVIFDGSNARWRVEKWKNECHDLGISYHDTSEKGAWVKQF
jgi:competence protein ComEC